MDKKTSDRFTSAVSANLAVLEKLQGLWMARAIHVAVRLGLPDLLGKGAKRFAELASATRCQEPTLRRLLRCLGPKALFGALLDLHMLVVHGGREGTEAEFAKLLLASGFQLQHVISTPTPASIIEAQPA